MVGIVFVPQNVEFDDATEGDTSGGGLTEEEEEND